MSGAGQTPKAPARPTRLEDGAMQYGVLGNEDDAIEVKVQDDGTVTIWTYEDEDTTIVNLHIRDRVALARQLLEGL